MDIKTIIEDMMAGKIKPGEAALKYLDAAAKQVGVDTTPMQIFEKAWLEGMLHSLPPDYERNIVFWQGVERGMDAMFTVNKDKIIKEVALGGKDEFSSLLALFSSMGVVTKKVKSLMS